MYTDGYVYRQTGCEVPLESMAGVKRLETKSGNGSYSIDAGQRLVGIC